MSGKCNLCPRECNADREKNTGYCGVSDKVKIAKAMLHFGEEPPISGGRGSGAVFFSGCNMRCAFCQNFEISHNRFGKEISVKRLTEIFLELQDKGADNINLVTATHYADKAAKAIEAAKPRLKIPVIFNCGGYEKIDTLKMLEGLVDIYLPDVKYFDDSLALRYSGAEDYFEQAFAAVGEMVRQTGKYEADERGLMKKGVIIRHLILPNHYKDSILLLRHLAAFKDKALISLMRQYYPCGRAADFPEIDRKLTTFEYKKVLEECEALGFDGFVQEKSSACGDMTPAFDLEGVQ
ncbi:MAG: radical SAM protein [Bacteroides sp.]|nr:radical SAM protein [Bacteroides sp.]